MKIILSGGGTLGPVTPLIAIYEIMKQKYPDAKFVWIGTKRGPEKTLVEQYNIKFREISSGKLRRYLSLLNVLDIFKVLVGIVQSFFIIWKEDPDICISVGGFVSVPVHFSAWILGVPSWIHQQDIQVGLANKMMVPFAKKITTSLEVSQKYFPKQKVQWLGNPVRTEIGSGGKQEAKKKFELDSKLPVLFVTGGGTGSVSINRLIVEAIAHLKNVCSVLHLTGKGRPEVAPHRTSELFDYYHVYKFFTDEMKDAYAVADLVIARAGFGTISELASLEKAVILIPKPGHQEYNAEILKKANAVVVVDERTANGHYLAGLIKELLSNEARRKNMAKRLSDILPVAKQEDIIHIIEELR